MDRRVTAVGVVGLALCTVMGCAKGSADIDQPTDDGPPTAGPGGAGGSFESGGRGGMSAGGMSSGGMSAGGMGSGGMSSGGMGSGGMGSGGMGGNTGGGGQGGLGGQGGGGTLCGNGLVNIGEACDDMDLSGRTCADFAHVSGALACNGNCTYDTSDCYTCGDAAIDGPEACDGVNLATQDCMTLMHDGGALACAADCLAFDEAACSDCGDSLVEAPEACDALNLNGEMCSTRGYFGGSLSCDGTCQFNESLCVAFECNDVLDNDGDGFTDLADPGCTSFDDNDESVFAPNCAGIGGPIYDVTWLDTTQDIVVTGTTAGGANNFGPPADGDCTVANGPEVVLLYRVFNTMDIAFSFNPAVTSWDTVLYIHQTDCLTPTAFACNDDYWTFPDLTSRLFVQLPPGDYFIFIDGYGAADSGNFELLIDLP